MSRIRNMRYAPYWRFFCMLFAAGCAAGLIFTVGAHRFRGQDVESLRILALKTFAGDSIDRRVYFQYLMARRMTPVLAGILLGVTAFGMAYSVAASLGYGFLTGTFFAMAVLQNGIGGLLLFLAALFPQCLVYAPAHLLLLAVVCDESEQTRKSGVLIRRRLWHYLLLSFLCVLLLLWGVLLEAYLNPALLSFFL